jgi:hypothetical protein
MKYRLRDFFEAIWGMADEGGLDGGTGGTATKSEFLHLVVDALDWMSEPECVLCGVDTDAIGEFYMVDDELWEKYGVHHHGQLCIGCLEERLGRKLTPADFTDATLNSDPSEPRSQRLTDRLSQPTKGSGSPIV